MGLTEADSLFHNEITMPAAKKTTKKSVAKKTVKKSPVKLATTSDVESLEDTPAPEASHPFHDVITPPSKGATEDSPVPPAPPIVSAQPENTATKPQNIVDPPVVTASEEPHVVTPPQAPGEAIQPPEAHTITVSVSDLKPLEIAEEISPPVPIQSAQQQASHEEKEEKPRGGGKKFIILVFMLVLFALIGLGGFFFYSLTSKKTTDGEATKDTTVVAPTTASVEDASDSAKLDDVDLSAYTLQVLNGSGTPGEAGKAATLLEEEGFKDIDTGNADKYTYDATEIQLRKKTPDAVYQSIVNALKDTYSVTRSAELLSEDDEYDIIVIVGTEGPSNDEEEEQ